MHTHVMDRISPDLASFAQPRLAVIDVPIQNLLLLERRVCPPLKQGMPTNKNEKILAQWMSTSSRAFFIANICSGVIPFGKTIGSPTCACLIASRVSGVKPEGRAIRPFGPLNEETSIFCSFAAKKPSERLIESKHLDIDLFRLIETNRFQHFG